MVSSGEMAFVLTTAPDVWLRQWLGSPIAQGSFIFTQRPLWLVFSLDALPGVTS